MVPPVIRRTNAGAKNRSWKTTPVKKTGSKTMNAVAIAKAKKIAAMKLAAKRSRSSCSMRAA